MDCIGVIDFETYGPSSWKWKKIYKPSSNCDTTVEAVRVNV